MREYILQAGFIVALIVGAHSVNATMSEKREANTIKVENEVKERQANRAERQAKFNEEMKEIERKSEESLKNFEKALDGLFNPRLDKCYYKTINVIWRYDINSLSGKEGDYIGWYKLPNHEINRPAIFSYAVINRDVKEHNRELNEKFCAKALKQGLPEKCLEPIRKLKEGEEYISKSEQWFNECYPYSEQSRDNYPAEAEATKWMPPTGSW